MTNRHFLRPWTWRDRQLEYIVESVGQGPCGEKHEIMRRYVLTTRIGLTGCTKSFLSCFSLRSPCSRKGPKRAGSPDVHHAGPSCWCRRSLIDRVQLQHSMVAGAAVIGDMADASLTQRCECQTVDLYDVSPSGRPYHCGICRKGWFSRGIKQAGVECS